MVSARRETWVGLFAVAVAVSSNILTKFVNFSIGAYPDQIDATRAVLDGCLGLVYAACAIIAWRLLPTRLVGWLMVLVALLWPVGSWLRALYDLGAVWPIAQGVTHLWAILVGTLVFCYPTGRFTRRFDRVILLAALSVFAVRFVATLLLDPRSSTAPSSRAANAYAVLTNPELGRVIENIWRLAGLALLLIVAIRVIIRWFASSPPARRVAFIMPIALILWTVATFIENTGFVFSVAFDRSLQLFTPIAISVIPIAFVTGLAHLRGLRARVSDLVVIARDGVDRLVWQNSLQRTLGDPSLRVFWWDERRSEFVDSTGAASDPAVAVSGRGGERMSLLPINADDRPLAVIRHDVGLTENTRLLDGVAAALKLSVDNDRLRTELEKTLGAVRESRLRIVEAGDDARRRIERDLHDGSQQALVSVAINLSLASRAAREGGNHAVGEQLETVSAQLQAALADLRALAHGIHPTALAEGGLETAVLELGARCPVDVDVDVVVARYLPSLAESTVYFVIAECLTNIAKYADASHATVRVARSGGGLDLEVSDDGRGTADIDGGTGIRGLIDRVETVGGRLTVSSSPGRGTRITGWVPLETDASGRGSAAADVFGAARASNPQPVG